MSPHWPSRGLGKHGLQVQNAGHLCSTTEVDFGQSVSSKHYDVGKAAVDVRTNFNDADGDYECINLNVPHSFMHVACMRR